jgi:hypothetical protein
MINYYILTPRDVTKAEFVGWLLTEGLRPHVEGKWRQIMRSGQPTRCGHPPFELGGGSARNSSQNIQFIRLVSDLDESKRNARYIQGLCKKKLNPLNCAVGIHGARARIICRENGSSHRGYFAAYYKHERAFLKANNLFETQIK